MLTGAHCAEHNFPFIWVEFSQWPCWMAATGSSYTSVSLVHLTGTPAVLYSVKLFVLFTTTWCFQRSLLRLPTRSPTADSQRISYNLGFSFFPTTVTLIDCYTPCHSTRRTTSPSLLHVKLFESDMIFHVRFLTHWIFRESCIQNNTTLSADRWRSLWSLEYSKL